MNRKKSPGLQEYSMHQENLPPYIQHLLKSGSYPHAADEITLIQTHISFVVVAGDFVYKWKKPVNFGFLNFSTLEMRRFLLRAGIGLESSALS